MTGSDPAGRLSMASFDFARSDLQTSSRVSAGDFSSEAEAAAEQELSEADAPAPTDAFRMCNL